MKQRSRYIVVVSGLAIATAFLLAQPCFAQNPITIDATSPIAAPMPVAAELGMSRSAQGDVLNVNSQYLTLNGKPWLPVMGEFHFSRYPDAEWEQEILKMKAAGVNIISTYVIWIHHEQNEGVFDWTGQRDLRRFVELCGKHGMYVYPRIGPWAHAETRNGGLPDWVVKNSAVRQSDPVYLKEVNAFYAEIGKQLHGLLWKDGGPVIGIQIENEYRGSTPEKGAEHIRTLKQMAVTAGLDVPLYTVTGWDGAAIPLDAVLPVFGGYPDAPWDGSDQKLPPNEIYAFRFSNRAAGSMGAIGGGGQNAASSYAGTPFFTAEVGSGIEDTYFRRPVVTADDIASIIPVMLGSGVNLLGYYMFHGGRNPEGGSITLQESQRTGYPTDVPVKSYDFQAPLGEFGQERESLRKLKLVHYFLNDFGELLAPMAVRQPSALPKNPKDTTIPRVAARTRGNAGFVFFNNHVRGVAMPVHRGFQVELRLPSGPVRLPQKPITLPSGAYGIWPVNLDLGGTTLRYSTAQLFKRVISNGRTYYFFFSISGVQPEFLLDADAHVLEGGKHIEQRRTSVGLRLRVRSGRAEEIRLPGEISLVILPETSAEKVWRGDDSTILVSSTANAFSDGPTWTLQATGVPRFKFGIFGLDKTPVSNGKHLKETGSASLFANYTVKVPAVKLQASVTKTRDAGSRSAWELGPKVSWRPQAIPIAPDDKEFASAAVWNIALPAVEASPNVSNIFLRIRYQGDAARLYRGDGLVDDSFWNGLPWDIGLREVKTQWGNTKAYFQLRELPLPQAFPMYLEKATQLHFRHGVAGTLTNVELIPQYETVFQIPAIPQAAGQPAKIF